MVKETFSDEKKLIVEEIKKVTGQDKLNEATNNLFQGKVGQKWARARANLLVAARLKKLQEELKTYGTNIKIFQNERVDILKQIVREEQFRQLKQIVMVRKKFLFYEDCRIRMLWQYLLMSLLIYVLVMTPFKIAFIDSQDNDYFIWFIIDLVIDVLFMIDIFFTLNSTFLDKDGNEIDQRQMIFTNYLKSWMLIDMIAIFPFDLLEMYVLKSKNESLTFSGDLSDLAKLARFPKLYRLFRIARLIKILRKAKKFQFFQNLQDYLSFSYGFFKLIYFLITLMVVVHYMGCTWFFIAKIQSFTYDSWVSKLEFKDSSRSKMYLFSIYYALSTISTVGFGDIRAFNTAERITAFFWMMFGAGFYSYTLGSLSSILANLDTRKAHLLNKITIMEQFCKETHIPNSLKRKIKKALEYNSIKGIFTQREKNEFLREIPNDIKFKIADSMFKDLTKNVPFFKNKDTVFISNFVPLLIPVKVNKGEFIYQKGEHPILVYFVQSGRINFVIGSQNAVYKTYIQGSYFGEIEIFKNISRMNSTRAQEECDLLTIQRDTFLEILQKFPDYYQEMVQTSLIREQLNQEALQKIKILLPISKNSHFWKQKEGEGTEINPIVVQERESKLPKIRQLINLLSPKRRKSKNKSNSPKQKKNNLKNFS